MAKLSYRPEVFAVPDEQAARQIILTPQAGQSPDERWARETPYLGELIAAEAPIAREALVVDFGCGIGRMAKELIDRFGCRVLGVDISPPMRGLAPAYVRSDRFSIVSPEMFAAMVLTGLRADAAISIWVLQHTLNPEGDIALLNAALRPGASVFVVNNLVRAVPAYDTEDKRFCWSSDGLDVRMALQSRFQLASEGVLDPGVVGGDISPNTFWAALTKG